MDSANDPWATNEAAQKTIHDTESCDDLLDLLLTIENSCFGYATKKVRDKRVKTKFTCATCKDSKCQIRQSCPDDETTQQKRPLTTYQIGEITL